MKIVPRFQDLKWQKWWPTMIQMNCHLLCWCQRVWTNLAGCCSKIWRNRPTWCFHLSAFQLLLLCSPLVQKGTPSHRWNPPSKSVTPIYSLPNFYFQIRESLSLPSHPETMTGYRYTQWTNKKVEHLLTVQFNILLVTDLFVSFSVALDIAKES